MDEADKKDLIVELSILLMDQPIEVVVDLINQGKELGEADDIVFGHSNSKQKNGAVGILTGNLIDRTQFYVEAMILALIPFLNKEIY